MSRGVAFTDPSDSSNRSESTLELYFELDDLVGFGQCRVGPFPHRRPVEDRLAIGREKRIERY